MNESRFQFYWDDIPNVKEEAVTYAELTMWWNTNEREVRRILHELSCYDNGDNYILIRSGQNKGFYKTDKKRRNRSIQKRMFEQRAQRFCAGQEDQPDFIIKRRTIFN